MNPTKRVSLDDARNRFSFTCPLFDSNTQMRHCTKLRDLVYVGKRPPYRKGCQAAIHSSKCPAAAMISLYIWDKTFDNDSHGSLEPKQGRLRAEVLEKVQRVMILPSTLDKFGVPAVERLKLEGANERIAEQLKGAPGKHGSRASDGDIEERTVAPRRKAPARPTPRSEPSAITTAAETGDLSAAINA